MSFLITILVIRYWDLKEEVKDKKRRRKKKRGGNCSLSIEHKEEIQFILLKSIDLLLRSIPYNNNYNNINFICADAIL